MIDSPHSSLDSPGSSPHTELQAIAAWLATPAPANAADELPALLAHLSSLRAAGAPLAQHILMLDRLSERARRTAALIRPLLGESALPLPLPRKTRPTVRNLLAVMEALADDLLAAAIAIDEPEAAAAARWRCIDARATMLLVGHLTAAPAGKGAWQQLHRCFDIARQRKLSGFAPATGEQSIQQLYFAAVLLGCAQPSAFTSPEVDFVAEYLAQAIGRIELAPPESPDDVAAFWIEAGRDAPAMAFARKAPPPDAMPYVFSCRALAALLKEQIAGLQTGKTPESLGLPEFAGTIAGRSVLRRLVVCWGEPGKRRFSRRRQNSRAVLCLGLDNVWRLFRDGGNALVDTSSWMIINESPDGYAVMHVSGKTGSLSVGDVLAIRTESGDNWQTCILRWALSENQEHLELGLQILSTQGMPAVMARPAEPGARSRSPVLILPKLKDVRAADLIVAAAGTLSGDTESFVLVIEKNNIEVREAKSTELAEQNGLVEVFAIEPVNLPA